MHRFWLLLVCLGCLSAKAHDDGIEVVLQPVADTTLFEPFPDNNQGKLPMVRAGSNAQLKRGRPLLRFELRGLVPTNAEIISATLTMKVVASAGPSPTPATFRLHRVLQPWIEGSGADGNTGAIARAGEPSWNQRAAGSAPWGQPGGVAGSDYVAEASSTQDLDLEPEFDFNGTPRMVADLNGWLANPENNFGWMIISSAEDKSQSARHFGSREDAAHVSSLALEYVLPSAEFRIEEFDHVNELMILHLELEANHGYRVEYKPVLDRSTWQVLTNFAAEPQYRHYVLADVLTNRFSRFYRLAVTPATNAPAPPGE